MQKPVDAPFLPKGMKAPGPCVKAMPPSCFFFLSIPCSPGLSDWPSQRAGTEVWSYTSHQCYRPQENLREGCFTDDLLEFRLSQSILSSLFVLTVCNG